MKLNNKADYDKAYKNGEAYLLNQLTHEEYEIFEESENQGEGYEYGLTLVEYEDKEHEVESNITSINLENFAEIKPNDIITIISLDEYKEANTEITDVIKQFANTSLEVISVSEDRNEFGERTITAFNHNGTATFTDHEIKSVVSKKYLKEISEKLYDECIYSEADIEISHNYIDYLLLGAINTLGLTRKGYSEFEDICGNSFINSNNYKVSIGYDVSGYDYWNIQQEEPNYVDYTITILHPLTDEDIKDIKEANRRFIQQLDSIENY